MENYAMRELTAEELYISAARGIAWQLDEYSDYMTAPEFESMSHSLSGNYQGVGVQFRIRLDGSLEVVNVHDGSPAKTAGILKGDIITSINGKMINGYTDETFPQMIARINGTVTLVVFRDGESKTFSMQKGEFQVATVEYVLLSEHLPEANGKPMGYILCKQIGERTAREMRAAVDRLKSRGVTQVVIDFRGNLGGYKHVIEEISRMFVPRGTVYSTIDAQGKRTTFNSNLTIRPFENVVILVDAETASACELFTAAMQDAKAATIIGQQTFGKGVFQGFAEFQTGDVLKYTSMEYLRRNGQKLHGIGITPDIVISKPRHVGEELLLMNNDGTGIGIENLNTLLAYIGYDVSGERYGDSTKAAVADIQTRAKLNPTGYCDIQTIQAINIAYEEYLMDNDVELMRAYRVLMGD